MIKQDERRRSPFYEGCRVATVGIKLLTSLSIRKKFSTKVISPTLLHILFQKPYASVPTRVNDPTSMELNLEKTWRSLFAAWLGKT